MQRPALEKVNVFKALYSRSRLQQSNGEPSRPLDGTISSDVAISTVFLSPLPVVPNMPAGIVVNLNSCFPSQKQGHRQRSHPLQVVHTDLPVRLRLPRAAAQVRPRAPQTALRATGSQHWATSPPSFSLCCRFYMDDVHIGTPEQCLLSLVTLIWANKHFWWTFFLPLQDCLHFIPYFFVMNPRSQIWKVFTNY